MNKYLILIILLLFPYSIFAFNPILNSVITPYEPMVVSGRIEEEAQYLGHLIGDPQMYEFTIGVESLLSVRVAQKDTESPLLLSIITVKENTNNAGVTEIGRLSAGMSELVSRKDTVLGMTFLESQFFTATLTPGTYRVEVSTPDNLGKYLLSIGTKSADVNYFTTLSNIRTVQKFFDYSIFALLSSSYIKYPLGIIILSILIYFTWRKRMLIQNIKHR